MKQHHLFSLLLSIFTITSLVPAQQQTAGERSSVDLTVYNSNMALIREERPIVFVKGLNHIIVPDIPATIDGTSLHFASLTDPMSVKILEQNYQYDLVHQAKLLEKYVGKEIEFIRLDEATKKEYTVSAKLLATGWQPQPQYGGGQGYVYSGQMIVEIGGKVEIGPPGRIELPSLSEGLILKPQLEWLVNASRDGQQKTEISYIANGITWDCDYVALLDAKDTKLDLTGWVTLTNNSGTTFRNAGLKLVAGDVNRVQEQRGGFANKMALQSMADAAAPQFQQKELFEYKLYALQRHTDLADAETKQIELTSGHDIASKKIFIYDGMDDSWRMYYGNAAYRTQESFGQQSNKKVGVFVTFRNDDKSGLGIPLPKGKVRVYKKDDDGKEQFIGEDQIDHTPKDEEVKLYLGNAFDIVGERKQTNFRTVVSGHIIEESFEIKLRNHKAEPVEVQVYEHPWRWSEWDIVKQSADWTKVDQTTIRFPVKLAKDEEKTVSYTIRYVW